MALNAYELYRQWYHAWRKRTAEEIRIDVSPEELRVGRKRFRQSAVTHTDRLWSRFRSEQKVVEELAELATSSGSANLEQFRFEKRKRRGKIALSEKSLSDNVPSLQHAEIRWQVRLAYQSQVTAVEETHALGGGVKMFSAKEQQRGGAFHLDKGFDLGLP